MKPLLFIVLSIFFLFVSCGHSSVEEGSLKSSADYWQVPPVSYTAEDAVQDFIAAGISKERLEEIKQDLLVTAKHIKSNNDKSLSIQGIQNVLNEVDILIKAIEIVKATPE